MADSILELEVRQKHTADTKDAEAAVQRLENANKKLELSYKNIDFSSRFFLHHNLYVSKMKLMLKNILHFKKIQFHKSV